MRQIAFGFLSMWLVLSTSAQTSHLVTTLFPTGPGSLGHYIINSSSGDTIRFDSGLFANGSDTIHVQYPYIFNHGLVIEGYINNGDTLYLSGGNNNMIFYMDFVSNPGEHISLRNLAFIDASHYAPDGLATNTHGGAIFARELQHFSLRNTLFRNCKALGNSSGGGILAIDCDSVKIEGCLFYYNSTDTTASQISGARGGACRIIGSKVLIDNSRFVGNLSAQQGGAIWTWNNLTEIKRSEFINNRSALSDGGAVRIIDHMFKMDSCLFENNRSERGGALNLWATNPDTIFHVSNCLFVRNQSGVYGNAIFSREKLVLINSTFIQNQGISNTCHALTLYKNPRIEHCTFINNQTESNSSLRLQNGVVESCTFISDSLSSLVRAFVDGNTIRIAGSIFSSPIGTSPFSNNALWISDGHNIFSNSPSFASSLDQTNVDSTTLALLPLGNYGGFAPTRPPSLVSPALNAGDSTNTTPAQNGPIYGNRDIGAAEYRYISMDTLMGCTPTTWWGNTYSAPGTYTDTAYNATTLDSVGILVLQPLASELTNQGGVLTAANQPPTATYQWVYCDSNHAPVPNATASTFLPAVNGSYALVSTYGNCTDTSGCVNYNEVSTQDLNPSKSLRFYPNPTTGRIQVQAGWNELPHLVEVLDLNGRLLASLSLTDGNVQLPPLATGMYLLRWQLASGKVQVDRISVKN